MAPLGLLRVDPTKDDRVARALDGGFRLIATATRSHELTLSHAETATLVQMGPSAHHIDSGELTARIAALSDPVRVTMSVTVATYARR